MQEMWVRSLSPEDPLEKGLATHSSILAWRIPMDRGAWRDTVNRITKNQTQVKPLSTSHVIKQRGCLRESPGLPMHYEHISSRPDKK